MSTASLTITYDAPDGDFEPYVGGDPHGPTFVIDTVQVIWSTSGPRVRAWGRRARADGMADQRSIRQECHLDPDDESRWIERVAEDYKHALANL